MALGAGVLCACLAFSARGPPIIGGRSGFATFSSVSRVMAPPLASTTADGPAAAAVKRYFDAWNRRDMVAACNEFDDACKYEDTQYAGAFEGKAALEAHLFKVADALPSSFTFCIDEMDSIPAMLQDYCSESIFYIASA